MDSIFQDDGIELLRLVLPSSLHEWSSSRIDDTVSPSRLSPHSNFQTGLPAAAQILRPSLRFIQPKPAVKLRYFVRQRIISMGIPTHPERGNNLVSKAADFRRTPGTEQ